MNKKGAALALVLMIGVVVAALGAVVFTMANSSIANADAGIKSKEAYNNAKSGYDFIRKLVPEAFEIAEDEMSTELAKKEGDSSYAPAVGTTTTIFLGYMDESGEFIFKEMFPANQISNDTPEFKNARIQVGLDFERTLSFVETDSETKAGTFTLTSTITAWSTGRSNEVSAFTDVLEKGITLDYSTSYTDSKSFQGEEGNDEIDYWIIPGTDVRVKYAIGVPDANFSFGTRLYKVLAGTTFYYGEKYYYSPHFAHININSTNDLEELKLGTIWNLDGWNGAGGKSGMYNHLRGQGLIGDLPKGSVVIVNNIHYIYLNGDNISFQKPPILCDGCIGQSWVRLNHHIE